MKDLYLTFDVEPFWANIPTYRSRDFWCSNPCVSSSVWAHRFLDYCELYSIPATLFIVGRWAVDNKDFVKRVTNSNLFEIGSHSYWHEDLSLKNESDFLSDVSCSKKILEDIGGNEVIRFRAPSFSLRQEQFLLLRQLGFHIDSSVTTSARFYGGGHSSPLSKDLNFFPLRGAEIFGKQITILGGGYLRLMPELALKYLNCFDLGNMVYLHPCDLPDRLSSFDDFSPFDNFRKTFRTGNMFRKLEILRSRHNFRNF